MHPPWVIISDYPNWPSPYFAQFVRYAPESLCLQFKPDIDAVIQMDCTPGVLNLHRLKRLYRELDGTRSGQAAQAFLERLNNLQQRGWRIVWTVHNLLPIDGGPPDDVDRVVVDTVLALADAVICHTYADSKYFRRCVTHGQVVVAGWSGMPIGIPDQPAPAVAALARSMEQYPLSFLLLGNMTAYKNLSVTFNAFLSNTHHARLFAIGPCRETTIVEELTQIAGKSSGRIHFESIRVDPVDVQHLYASAVVAVCPYASTGTYSFFTQVLHPSSVGTAVVFGVPVIAPELPSIVEMTADHPRILYPLLDGPGHAFATAERTVMQTIARSAPDQWIRNKRVPRDDGKQWRHILETYESIARMLLETRQ